MPYATLADAWGDDYKNFGGSVASESDDMSIAVRNPYKSIDTQRAILAKRPANGGAAAPSDASIAAALELKYQTDGAAGVRALLPREMVRRQASSPPRPPVERVPGAWATPRPARGVAEDLQIDPAVLLIAGCVALYFIFAE